MSHKTTALTREQFEAIVNDFHKRPDLRMEIVCLLLGRCIRVGDVLRTLTPSHLYTLDGSPRDVVGFDEEKTGKWRTITIGAQSRLDAALREYWPAVQRNVHLFTGQRTGLRLHDKGVKKLLAEFVGWRGIDQCSPHSFRKYGAKYMWEQGIDIETVSQILNHSSVRETRTYLDIKARELQKAERLLVV